MQLARAALLSLLCAAGAAAAQSQAAAEPLLRSARLWESKNRADLARVALEKYLYAVPGDPRALLMLGELEVRSNNAAAADKLLQRLRTIHPGDPAIRYLEDAYRIGTRDRLKMATVNRLVQIGDHEAAISQLHTLFPNGAAGGGLGIDYNRVLASSPAHRAAADAGFRRLVRDNPGDPLFEMALAEHLLGRAATRTEGLRLVAALGRRQDVDHDKVMAVWRAGVMRLPPGSTAPQVQDYLAVARDDSEIRQRLGDARQARERAEARAADPVLRLLESGLGDLDQGRLAEAEIALVQAFAARPQSGEIAGALGRLRLRQGQYAEARSLFEQAVDRDSSHASRWRKLIAEADFQQAIGRADSARAAGDLASAERQARAALALRPDAAEALTALADVEAQRGQLASAELLYRKGLARQPGHGPALRGLLRILDSTQRRSEGLALIEALRAEQPEQADTLDGLLAGWLREQGKAALAAEHGGEALRLLELAQIQAPADPWIRFDLARLYQRMGLADEARELMAEGAALRPDDTDIHYASALLLSSLDDDAAAMAALQRVPAAQRSVGMNALESRLVVNRWRQEAAALVQRGERAAAELLLQQAVVRAGDNIGLLTAVASSFVEFGWPQQGLDLMRDWMQAHAPVPPEVQLAWARLLNQARVDSELATVLAQLGAAPLSAEDRSRVADIQLSMQLRQADTLARQRRYAEARELLAPLLLGEPKPAVLAQAGRLERAARRYDDAAALFRRAGSSASEDLASLERRRHGFITAGSNYSDKAGDPGISQYTVKELATELRLAEGYDGHWFALVDRTHADAGTLPSDYDGAGLYGKNAAFGTVGYRGGIAQSASGTAVGLGWESDDWRIDLGTTPIGFPVQDIVGGVRHEGRVGVLNYSLDASRRPLTSSLLSYAGARDPVTGETWGGARSNGLDTRLAYYGERYSTTAALGYHEITGRNLPGNGFASARLSGDRRVHDSPNQRLTAGLAATYWAYSQNLSRYTFGHGGYYSPQSYVSLALPLEWTGRRGDFSYRLRGSGSISQTRQAASVFFPNDPALQQQATGVQPLPRRFSAPVFGARSGLGAGYSLAGNAEYRLLPRWFIGGQFQIDRSAFYTPNFFSAYLRYDFDLQDGPVLFPPRPVRSYSSF